MTGPNNSGVAIVGASSPIGLFLILRLRDRGLRFHAIGRQTRPSIKYSVHGYIDRAKRFEPPIREAQAIVNCAPLPTIDRVMEMADCLGVRRIIAFGSTGRFSKSGSISPVEQDFVNQQIEAECRFEARSRKQGIAWTLFRPTMIYGAGSDLTVAFIGRFIQRFGFFPVPRGPKGLRQPVHADDLASACLAAMDCQQTFGRAYDLGGGERLSYDEMVRRIFSALRLPSRILPVPLWIYQLLVQLFSKIPRYRFINRDMIRRIYTDLTADITKACSDFGYAPRKFIPTVEDISGPAVSLYEADGPVP